VFSDISSSVATVQTTPATDKLASLLLVDDDPQIVRAILPALAISRFQVTVATTGYEAIDSFDAGDWDALVVDLGLPDMDGKSIVAHVRQSSNMPIIVISAQHSREEVAAAHLAGATCFVHKPFRTPDLVKCLLDRVPAFQSLS
jgi:two-component system KDP operon response regulator KdpE